MQLNRGCSRRLLKLVLCGAILAPRKSLAGGPIERLCKIGHSERIWLDEAGLAQINSITSSLCRVGATVLVGAIGEIENVSQPAARPSFGYPHHHLLALIWELQCINQQLDVSP